MSEYQYHDFLAIDRPLDPAELDEVGSFSSRPEITATRFTNTSTFGDFRGDPRKMMEHYYDAHLFVAGWGTHQVMLRLPRHLLDLGDAQPYMIEDLVDAWPAGEHLILDLRSDNESGDRDTEAGNALPAIAGVREELASGDLRPLYLAWLAAIGGWEHDEDAFDEDFDEVLEPPVPTGLGSMTAPQRALAGFLRLDPDLLAVAAEGTGPRPPSTDDRREIAAWIATLAETEKNEMLVRVCTGNAAHLRQELLRRFHGSPAAPETGTRTVADLLDAAALRRHGDERDMPG